MKKIIIIFSVLVVIAATVLLWQYNNKKTAENIPKKRACPDNWIENRMLGSKPSQYFIINGQRQELVDYDVEWIKTNCKINQPSPVY